MANIPDPPASRWSTKKKLLLQVVLIPGMLLVLEGGYRGWQMTAGGKANARKEIARLADEIDRPPDAFGDAESMDPDEAAAARERLPNGVLNPYYGWDLGSIRQQVPTLADYFENQGDRFFDVLIVGGSVAASWTRDTRDLLIELLEAGLEGQTVRLHGRGRGGFKQPQQLNMVSYLLNVGWKPDAVINLDGFNEVALALQNDDYRVHPLHPAFFLWGHLAIGDPMDRAQIDLQLEMRSAQIRARELADRVAKGGLWRSAILADLALRRMLRITEEYSRAYDAYAVLMSSPEGERNPVLGPDYDRKMAAVLHLAVQNWAESSRSLQAICDARSIAYLHVLQPTLHDEGSKPLTQEEIDTGKTMPAWMDAAKSAYPSLRREGDHLAEQGVNFMDASMAFEDVHEPLYYDSCHFVKAGNEILAREIVARFLETTLGD